MAGYDSTIYDTPTFTGVQPNKIPTAPWTPPKTIEDYQNTPPPPPPSYAKGPGRWIGNQWVEDSVYPPGTGGYPAPGVTPDPIAFPPPTGTTGTTPSGAKPSLNPKDAASVDAYLAWMAKQPGINPSVINDPGYWRQKLLSGELGTDESYISQRMFQAEGAPAGSSGTGGLNLAGLNFGSLFDDPAAAQLMQLLTGRINQLTQPINDPNAAAAQAAIQNALMHLTNLPALAAPTPVAPLADNSGQVAAILKALEDQRTSTTGATQQYRDTIDTLVKQLSLPAFSDDQLAQLKTAAVDTLNHEHQQATENTVRQMGMRGVSPSSGLVQEAIKNVDQQYQQLKAQALQAQNTKEIDQINQRRQQLMQAASSGLEAAQGQANFEQNNILAQLNAMMNARNQDINVRGQSLQEQANLQNFLLNQRNQDLTQTTTGVTLAQALAQLSRDQRNEQNTNLNQAVQYAGIPVDLSAQRLSQALQVLGLGAGGTSPKDLLTALSQISQQAGLANQLGATQNAGLGDAVGRLLAGLHL
jgi:hypothetical protein